MKRLTYWELTIANVKGFRDLIVVAHNQDLNEDYEITIKSPRQNYGWVAFWTDGIGDEHRLEVMTFTNSKKPYIHSIKEGGRWIDTHGDYEDRLPFIPDCIYDAIDLAIERYSKNYGE